MNDEKNSFKNPNFNNYSNINFETFLTQNIEVAIIIILIFICITGNSLLFFIICSNKHLRTPSNLFCMNLSLADFLIGSTILPYWAAATSWQAWYLSKTICSMMAFIYIALITSSTLTLAAISVDRYLCICHPLHYPVFMTHHRVYILIFFIWLLGILLACTPFWGWGEYKFRPQKIPICSPIFTGYVGYSSFLWTIIFFAPVVIILCSYCLILKAVKNQVQRIGIFEPQISQSHNDLETIRNSPNQNSSNHYRNICLFFYKHKSIKTFFIIIGEYFSWLFSNYFFKAF